MARRKNIHRDHLVSSTCVARVWPLPRAGVVVLAGVAGMMLAGTAPKAHALNLYDGMAHGNSLEINLNTTLSYTGIVRTNPIPAL